MMGLLCHSYVAVHTGGSPLCVCSLGQPLKPVLRQDFQPVTVELGILQST